MSNRTIIVAGASGLVGSAAVRYFGAREDWNVIAVSRRPPLAMPARVRHVAVDLADERACAAAFGAMSEVTHVVYTAVAEKLDDIYGGWSDPVQIAKNAAMLRNLMENGFIKSMIFITHELPLLKNVTDDIMVMYAGQIVEKGTAEQTVFDPIHPYAKGLMGSIIVPESGLRKVKLTAIPGVPPNLKNPPHGCRFADRCRYVTAECRMHPIEIRQADGEREYRCIFSEDELRKAYQND